MAGKLIVVTGFQQDFSFSFRFLQHTVRLGNAHGLIACLHCRNTQCLKGWWSYLKIAVPSLVSIFPTKTSVTRITGAQIASISGSFSFADACCVADWSWYVQAMICVEWWCFEAIILLAGRLPQPEVAIDIVGICVNIATTTFMFPFGLAGELRICWKSQSCRHTKQRYATEYLCTLRGLKEGLSCTAQCARQHVQFAACSISASTAVRVCGASNVLEQYT